jgi:superfamily II DNA or RNA helicase
VHEQGRKVVIFSQWRRMLALAHWAVGDLLADRGLRAGFFTGAEGQKRRTQNIVEFHDDPRFSILFASDAGGVGLNLQHAANCVINLELPWNPAVLEQRIGRVYRLGQENPIDVYNLVCEQGIESRIAGLVGSKQAFFKGLFDGESDSVQFEQSGSFLSRVEKIYDSMPSTSSQPDDFELAEIADAALDDEINDPFEPIIEAADESRDPLPSPAPEVVATVDRGEPPAILSQSANDVRGLFSQLQVRREPNGKVIIEAPPEAASALSALFEGLASLIQSVSVPQGSTGPMSD